MNTSYSGAEDQLQHHAGLVRPCLLGLSTGDGLGELFCEGQPTQGLRHFQRLSFKPFTWGPQWPPDVSGVMYCAHNCGKCGNSNRLKSKCGPSVHVALPIYPDLVVTRYWRLAEAKVCSSVSSTWGLQCVLAAFTTPSDSAWKKCLAHSRCQRATENSEKTRAPTPSATRRTRVTVRMTSTWKTLRIWLWLKKMWNSWRRTTTCLQWAVGQPPVATSATESVGF